MEISTKMAHAIGTARTAVADLKANGAAAEVISAVTATQAKKWGISQAEWEALLASKPASKSGKIGETKEQYRQEFDRRTNDLLFAINHAEGEVGTALKALLDYDRQYQEVTGIVQTDRTDFRGMIILSAHPKNLDKLAIYRGGWGDGSKQDRNQYSNGRRVAVAKTTGYALDQELPAKAEGEAEAPTEPVAEPTTPPKKTHKAK